MEYDYEAQHTDELTIRVGDVVTDLAPTEPGWMRGKLNGKVGVFPDNFVKVGHALACSRVSLRLLVYFLLHQNTHVPHAQISQLRMQSHTLR